MTADDFTRQTRFFLLDQEREKLFQDIERAKRRHGPYSGLQTRLKAVVTQILAMGAR